MTTLLESPTDSLISFLRSREPIPRKPTRPAATKPERRPLSPVQAATLRRPPRAAAAYYASERAARDRRDYSQAYAAESHGRRLNQVECRIIGWLVCRALGDDWAFEPGDNGWHRIRHIETGASLCFGQSWNHHDRYQISADDRYNRDALPTITVSAERTPADIAGDVQRRLIAKGFFEQHAQTLAATAKSRRDDVQRRREVLAAAAAYGGKLREQRRWRSASYPEATEVHLGRRQTADGEHGHETSVSVQHGYYGLEFNLCTKNAQFATALGDFIRQYYA